MTSNQAEVKSHIPHALCECGYATAHSSEAEQSVFFFAVDLDVVFLAVVFFAVDLEAVDFDAVFFVVVFLAAVFLAGAFLPDLAAFSAISWTAMSMVTSLGMILVQITRKCFMYSPKEVRLDVRRVAPEGSGEGRAGGMWGGR